MPVAGTQTSQKTVDKQIILKGDATLPAAEDTLTLTIPADEVAPAGRKLKVMWTLTIIEQDAP